MDRARVARAVLAIGAIAYAALVWAMSRSPGPRAWALHLPGFLPPAQRLLILATLFLGALLILADFLRGKGAPRKTKKRGGVSLPGWSGWLLLVPWAWLLWKLEIKTRFLGDATVWMAGLINGEVNPSNEPLAAALWMGFASVLRSLAFPITPATVASLSILCGLLAAALLWGIASEIAPRSVSRVIVMGVLATLGLMQLYFGYIESYPVVSVFVLAFLWLGLRRLRGMDSPFLVAAVLGLTIASHLAAVLLLPGYAYLVLREKRPAAVRALLAIFPIAVTAAVLIFLQYPFEKLVLALRIATHAVEPGHAATAYTKPYSIFSLDHARDILNGILLAMPVPAMLLLASAAAWLTHRKPAATSGADPGIVFLALAAAPGLLVAWVLVLPVVPAQDWDLTSILLLPLAVFGVKAACSIPGSPLRGASGAGLVLIGAGALFSFVLVNATVESGVSRFETLVGPGARASAYGRAYGNELLSTFDSQRGDTRRMLVHAGRALDAEPTNPRYWVGKGAALYNLGRYAEAIPVLEEGIRRGPARDDAYYNLGNCLVHEKRYDEAVQTFREAVLRSEPRPDYLNNLGVALYHAGKTDSARTVLNDVARRWPDYTLTRNLIARWFGAAAADSARASAPPR
ncbi:MAG TPA: tetratricopeptide repeat protein [Candidatus Dormibacteraeota bacterium]|nr:tetratricopeptide repeat protein [Candidatus Dormibacteraeota bacterium]